MGDFIKDFYFTNMIKRRYINIKLRYDSKI